MKTKLFTLLLAVAASIGTMFAWDYKQVQIGNLYYNIDATNKTAEVTSKNGKDYSGDIVIPASVIYGGQTYSVTSIADNAFAICSGLTSIEIPNSVTNIGNGAFVMCTGMTSVTIGNSVTSIGEAAFAICSSLTSVTIPNSVTSIGNDAFSGCSGLTSMTIPNSVTSIGEGAFSECSGLTSINVETSNLNYCSVEGVLFNKDKTELIQYPIGNSRTEYVISNSVTSIGEDAFAWCSGLTSVTIEAETPPTLGKNAFYNTNSPIYVPCGTLDAYKTAWTDYASRISYAPLPYKISTQAVYGSVGITSLENYTICDEQPYYSLTVTANYGYHFVQWSDGNTDNPRTIILASDTSFTAEFAKNTYTISTTSANPEWGTTAGGKSALYLDEVEISATANYGYHFVKWNDNSTANPRTVSATEDKTYTAAFAKNVYSITANAAHGSISGNNSAEYLDFVTLTVVPDYGYHFTQWSDGLKDNPRIFQITKDTTFTAEFAYDRVGTCGKDLALVWSYDPTNKVLTIGNAGEFTENMRFGVEAPTEMRELVIGNSVTAIGANAFAGIKTLSKVTVGDAVKTIGEQAFYDCTGLTHITCYRERPSVVYSNTFDGIDKFDCTLHVLSSSVDMYKAATGWRDFYYIKTIDAATTTISSNDVTVEPSVNTATVTWPTQENAATYTIQITKDGEVFCTLIFNANGQLVGIAFAPSREGSHHAPAAIMTANGLQFTVTGLDSNTQYGYSVTAKDSNDQPVATYSGEFTTTSEGIATGVEEVSSSLQGGERGRLILHNGQILILRGDKTYTLQGQEVK